MEDLNVQTKHQHRLTMTGRKNANLTGILDVISFDPGEILLETDMGMLMIKGGDLHVKRLSLEKGEVEVEGRIDSLTYSENVSFAAKSESLLKRMFK
jgi:sporulation protein YabP